MVNYLQKQNIPALFDSDYSSSFFFFLLLLIITSLLSVSSSDYGLGEIFYFEDCGELSAETEYSQDGGGLFDEDHGVFVAENRVKCCGEQEYSKDHGVLKSF